MQKKTNSIGFPRRQARKTARHSTSVSDVYEFQPEKVRRSRVALRLTKGELAEFGRDNASDQDGGNSRGDKPQPRLVGQNSDDEGMNSEDDEDIDSDAAFGGSDEETFAGYGFTRKVPKHFLYHVPDPSKLSLARVEHRKNLNKSPPPQGRFTLRSISMRMTKED